jgi:hypothetical protein
MSNEIAKTNTGLATTPDYGDVEGSGFENQTRDDMSTPYLSLLQTNSPQCGDVEDGGLEGAKPGMFLNSATEELYDGRDGGVIVVPATTQHLYVEYKPRDEGGGFVSTHAVASDIVRHAKAEAVAFNRLKSPEGNDLTEAFYVYAVVCEDGEPLGGIVIPFTSTKIKTYKKWNTRIGTLLVPRADGTRRRPPMFAHQVRITSLKQENQHGKFFVFDLAPAKGTLVESLLEPDDPCFVAAQDLMNSVAAGETEAKQPASQDGGGEANSDNVPF